MKYLKSIYEKHIVTSKTDNRNKLKIENLEEIFFEIILLSIKSKFQQDIDLIIEEINKLNDTEQWIQFIQKNITDEDKKLLGEYFLNNYFYTEGMNDQKRTVVKYIKTELYQYITDKT